MLLMQDTCTRQEDPFRRQVVNTEPEFYDFFFFFYNATLDGVVSDKPFKAGKCDNRRSIFQYASAGWVV